MRLISLPSIPSIWGRNRCTGYRWAAYHSKLRGICATLVEHYSPSGWEFLGNSSVHPLIFTDPPISRFIIPRYPFNILQRPIWFVIPRYSLIGKLEKLLQRIISPRIRKKRVKNRRNNEEGGFVQLISSLQRDGEATCDATKRQSYLDIGRILHSNTLVERVPPLSFDSKFHGSNSSRWPLTACPNWLARRGAARGKNVVAACRAHSGEIDNSVIRGERDEAETRLLRSR